MLHKLPNKSIVHLEALHFSGSIFTSKSQIIITCQLAGVNIFSEFRDLTTTECNNKDFSQKPTSWRWNSDQQNEEIGLPFSRGRGTNWEVMVGGAGDCARSVSTLRPTKVINSDDDNGDEDDSSSSHREWNEILISMQQKGKRQASKHS